MSTIQSPETLANMKKTVQALVHAYNEWNYEATKATQAEDFTFEARPLSMGRESLNGEQFKDLFINFLAPSFKDFKVRAAVFSSAPPHASPRPYQLWHSEWRVLDNHKRHKTLLALVSCNVVTRKPTF